MKAVLEKALVIGSQSVLTDSEKLYRIVEDIVPERRELVGWLKKHYDADSLKKVFITCNQTPAALGEWMLKVDHEYTSSTDQSSDNTHNKKITEKEGFMRCGRCGSEWRTTVLPGEKENVCPFCNAHLQSDKTVPVSDIQKAPDTVRQGDDESAPKAASSCIERLEDGSVIEGTKINGIWEGRYKKTLTDGSYWTGTYVSGVITGEVTYVNSEGYTVVGTWKNDNWNGRYRQENGDGSVTEGMCVNGVLHGPFVETFQNGSMYRGTYVNGEIVGELTYKDEKGNIFICNWKNGNWNGKGVYRSKLGVLTGTWVDGEVSGKARYRYVSGQVYEGNIRNFQRNGKGVLMFPNLGVTLEGKFWNDIPQGNVTIHFPDGAYYEGSWCGSIFGNGTFYSNNCLGFAEISYTGHWQHGLPSGTNGVLKVIPVKQAGVIYKGEFAFGVICGEGHLFSIGSYGDQDPLTYGVWKDNKVSSKFKSRAIRNGEELLTAAMYYIRNVTAVIG